MNCEKCLPLIEDLIEGEIEAPIAGQIDSHLRQCVSCSTFYKTLEQEKNLYAQYLYDIEPARDLWAQFQTKLNVESETVQKISEKSRKPLGWADYIHQMFRPFPAAIAFTAVLIAFGFGLFNFRNDEAANGEDYGAQKENGAVLTSNNSGNENKAAPQVLPTNSAKTAAIYSEAGKAKNVKSAKAAVIKTAAVKKPQRTEKLIADGEKQRKAFDYQSVEKQQLRQLIELEQETARQIEKAEILLRAFRNARTAEGDSIYDVEYEKQQARRLLEKNTRLRQIAENYGSPSMLEIFDKVEPFLLEIANLENSPAAEKVLEIKERVRNQNIIASLQVY